jgi:hypothetical protein
MEQLVQRVEELTGAMNAMVARNQENERTILALREQLNNRVDMFRIPDPIKAIQSFDGSKKHLATWLNLVERALRKFDNPAVTDQQRETFFDAVINKLEGRAREVVCLAGNINNFDELKIILTDALGDRQELSTYKSQLWQNKMSDDISIHKYYANTKTIVQNIKTLSKQKQNYNENWEAINAFIEEDALAAFISGLRKPYFGYAQAAKPASVEEAYAFLCKFQSNEKTSTNMNFPKKTGRDSKPGTYKPEVKKDFKNPGYKNDGPSTSKEEPMEIDRSLRSRVSMNKKLINNHECTSDTSEDENEEVAVNFWMAPQIQDPT